MSTSNGNGVINRVFISDGDDHVKEVREFVLITP